MIRWEYATVILYAHIDEEGVKGYLQQTQREWKNLPIHHISTLEPQLNKWGEKGWELVHIEPINAVGKKGDLGFVYVEGKNWRKHFFCLFKRPI